MEIFCTECNRIEYGVEPEIYSSINFLLLRLLPTYVRPRIHEFYFYIADVIITIDDIFAQDTFRNINRNSKATGAQQAHIFIRPGDDFADFGNIHLFGFVRVIVVGENHNINWEVKKGDHWILFGLNGSGKTTLLSIIAGFHARTSGKVEVFGEGYTDENISAVFPFAKILPSRSSIAWSKDGNISSG